MKYYYRAFIILTMLTVGSLATVRTANATVTSMTVTSLSCNSNNQSVTFSVVTTGSGSFDLDVSIDNIESPEVENINGNSFTAGNSYTFTVQSSLIHSGSLAEVENGSPAIASTTCSGGPVTFCNLSADGRVNGLCGDRIAVYCNKTQTPPNVDVWVIDNSSVGHELAKLPLSDLTSVPEGQFAKNLGANGVIFAGSDASGNVYVALQGGPYGGTAKGDWLKTFSCKG